jgi:hypothetical protein
MVSEPSIGLEGWFKDAETEKPVEVTACRQSGGLDQQGTPGYRAATPLRTFLLLHGTPTPCFLGENASFPTRATSPAARISS